MLGDRVSRGLLRECLDRERFATKRTILLGSSKNAWGKRGRGDGGGGGWPEQDGGTYNAHMLGAQYT